MHQKLAGLYQNKKFSLWFAIGLGVLVLYFPLKSNLLRVKESSHEAAELEELIQKDVHFVDKEKVLGASTDQKIYSILKTAEGKYILAEIEKAKVVSGKFTGDITFRLPNGDLYTSRGEFLPDLVLKDGSATQGQIISSAITLIKLKNGDFLPVEVVDAQIVSGRIKEVFSARFTDSGYQMAGTIEKGVISNGYVVANPTFVSTRTRTFGYVVLYEEGKVKELKSTPQNVLASSASEDKEDFVAESDIEDVESLETSPDPRLVTSYKGRIIKPDYDTGTYDIAGLDEGSEMTLSLFEDIIDLQISNVDFQRFVDASVVNQVGGSLLLTENSILTSHIKDGEVKSEDILDATITSLDIKNVTIKNEDLTDDSINSPKIEDDTVTSSDLSSTLTFSDGDFLDLSDIVHDDTNPQGFRLPGASSASPSEPSEGEGYLAYDTADKQVIFYNGTSWGAVGSGDITGVTVGNGLSGGGTEGTVTVDIDVGTSGTTSTTYANSGLETASDGLSMIRGCSANQILKWDSTNVRWACAADNSGAGGASLDSLTAATANGIVQDSNAYTVNWNWDFTTASVDSGLNISESSASTNGTQDQQALVEITTLTGSTASPFQITNASTDAGDVFIDLTNSGDFEIRDSGTAFATFADNGSVTFTGNITANDSGADTILIGQSGATDDTVTIAGDVSITDDQWSISSSGAATGLSGTNTSFTAGDLSCTDCIGSTEISDLALGTDTSGDYVRNLVAGNGISASVTSGEGQQPTVALTALTSNWNQTAAFDIVLNNASSELTILESDGGTSSGTLDVGSLSADAVYSFVGTTGNVITTSNASTQLSTWDTTASDDLTTANYATTLDSVYVNVGESLTASDIAGSFSGGLTINSGAVDDAELADTLTYTGALSVGNLTISDINVPLSGTSFTFDFNNASDRTLTISNSGSGNASLSVDGTISASNFSGSSSGSNTGDQTITLQGDVTGGGVGTFTATIADQSIDYADLDTIDGNSAIDEMCLTYESGGANGTYEWQSCGSGSQSPWIADINAAGYDLTDTSNILFRETTGAPTGTDVGFYRDNAGDLTANVLTAKSVNVAVNGTDEYNFSSSALAMNSNNLTGVGTNITSSGTLTIASTTTGLTLDSGSGTVSIAAGDTLSNGTWSISSTGAGTALTATDLNCTDCIGATEISDLALGTDTSGNYVAGATTNAGLSLSGTEGATLGISLQANKGLEVDTNGLSLVDCGDGQILKYSTGTNQWSCQADNSGSGAQTLQQTYVEGSTIDVTSGEGALGLTLTSANFTVDAVGGSTIFEVGAGTDTGDFQIWDGTDNWLLVDESADTMTVGAAAGSGLTLGGASVTTSVPGTLAADGGITTDTNNFTVSGTTGAVSIIAAATTGNAIAVSYDAGTQTGNMSGVDVDFTNITDAANTLYGVHVNDAAGTSSTSYGVYVEGVNWDYGVYSADDVWFNTTSTFVGNADVRGDLADSTGNLTLNDAVDVSGALDVNSASTITSLSLDANSGTALTVSGTSFTTDVVLQNAETIDNDTNGRISFGNGTIALGYIAANAAADGGILYVDPGTAPAACTQGEVYSSGTNLYYCESTNTWVDLTVQGSSLTPWTTDVDADGYDLTDTSNILFRETTGAPTGTDVGFYRDNAGDLTANVLTAKSVNVAVNGTDEYNFSSSALAMNSNNLTGVGTNITSSGTLTIASTTTGLTLDSGSGTVSIAAGDTLSNGTWSISSTGAGTALTATDLNCTDCIGATEISDLALGTDTSGNYVAGATTNAGLSLSGTEGATLGISLQANKGLEVDTNGLSLVDCGDGQILKYSTGTNQWSCQADNSGSGAQTLQQTYVEGSTIDVTSGEGALGLTLTSANFTVDAVGGSTIFEVGAGTDTGDFQIWDGTDNWLLVDESADTMTVGAAAGSGLTLGGASVTTSVPGTLAADGGITTDTNNFTVSGTTGAVSIIAAATTGNAIAVSYDAGTQTGNMSGVDVDFTNITDAANTLYGVHVNDAAGTSSTSYGVYVEGVNWDYGVYSADDVWFNTTSTFVGNADVRGDLADSTGNLTLNDAVDVSGALDVNSASTITSLSLDANSGTALTVSGTSFTTDVVLQNAETIDNDTNGRISFGNGTIALGYIAANAAADGGILYVDPGTAPAACTQGEVYSSGTNLYYCESTNTWVDLTVQGSSLTPWTTDVDADGYDLTDTSNILFRETTGAPTGTDVGFYRDNAGDLTANVLTAKSVNVAVNGTDEYNFSSSALAMNSNNLTGVGTNITSSGTLTIASTTTGLTLDSGSGTVSIAAGDTLSNGTWSISSTGAGTALTATDLNCTDCIGATEISDLALGTDTSGNYVAGATTNAGLSLSGTEGATLGISLQANKGLEVDTNGLSLVDCGDGQILKYSTGTNQWSCQADNSGSGAQTLQQTYVEGSTIDVTSGEGALGLTLTSANFTVDAVGGSTIFEVGAGTDTGDFQIWDGTDNWLLVDESADTMTVGAAAGSGLTLGGASVTTSVPGTLAADGGITTDTNNFTVSGTTGAVSIIAAATTGNAIAVSYDAGTQTGNMSGVDVDFTNITDAANTLYGVHVNDAAGTSSTSYGVYVEGVNWDYGVYSADDVWFNTTSTFVGNADVRGDLADSTGNLTLNDAVDVSGALDVNSASTITSLSLDANSGTALTVSGTSFTTDVVLQNAETIDNDTNGRISFGNGTIALGYIAANAAADGGILYVDPGTAPAACTQGEVYSSGTNLYYCESTNTWVDLTVQGSSLTPWTTDVDADGYDLTDTSNILFRETTGAPTGTDVGFYRDNAGDLTANVLTAKSVNVAVNGTDEYNFSSSALAMNSNNLTGVGTNITSSGTLTIASTTTGLTLDSGSGTVSIAAGDTLSNGTWSISSTGAGTALTATDLSCTNCLNTDEIDDVYLLNNGDNGTGSYTWEADHTFTLAEAEDVAIDWSVSGTQAGQAEKLTITNSSSSGNQYGLYIDNLASSGTTDALIYLDNSDTDTVVTNAIQVANTSRFTNLFNIGGTTLTASEVTVLDSGVALSELTDSGDLTASQNIDFADTGADTITIGDANDATSIAGTAWGVNTSGVFTGDSLTLGNDTTDITTTTDENLTLVANGTGTIQLNDAVTVTGTLAANGGITFDSAADTVGAHTLSGTLDVNSNILTNIGSTGTDFDTSGGLTLTLDAAAGTAALVVNNSTQASSIFVAQDNGGAVFTIADGGNVTTTGTLAVNGDSITADGATLTINAQGTVDVDDVLNANSITSDAGVSIAAGSSYTGAGAVILSSGGANTLSLDTGGAAAIQVGSTTNATSVSICNSANCDTINIGNLATVDADSILIGDSLDTVTINSNTLSLTDDNWSIGTAGAASFASVTSSGTIAANGGITFDSAADTVGAHTLSGTLDVNSNILTNVGSTGTDFDTSGGLTLTLDAAAGTAALVVNNSTQASSIFVAQDNGGAVFTIADGGNVTTTGTLAVNGDSITADGTTLTINAGGTVNVQDNLDVDGTIQAGSSNVTLTLTTGYVDADSITLASVNANTGTSSTSGLMTSSDGLTLLQGCNDNQILKWTDAAGWACQNDAGASSFGASGGMITKTDITDYLLMQYGDAADTQIVIENTTSGTVPTADAMQITLTGGTAGITTAGVDAMQINWEAGHMSAGGTISGINLGLTPISTSTTSSDIFNGITIAGITGTTATENAISIGSGWDVDITTISNANLDIGANGTGDILLLADADTSINFGTTSFTSCDSLGTDSSGNVTCTGIGNAATFVDTTPVAFATNNTTELWNDATRPNITTKVASAQVMVDVHIWGDASNTTSDQFLAARVIFTNDQTNPNCTGGTQVGEVMVGGFTTTTTHPWDINGTFLHTPSTSAEEIRYTVCSSASGLVATDTADDVRVTLVELGADLAENYRTGDSSISPGDVVSIDPDLVPGVKKSSRAYDSQVIGVISTNPAKVLNDPTNWRGEGYVPVALSGRIPVKVSAENGRVKAGDYLTTSSVPGVAMKATKAGSIIGQAMQDFSYMDNDIGLVVAFVKTSFFTGESLVTRYQGIEFETEVGEDSENALSDNELARNILSVLVADKGSVNSYNLSEVLTDRLAAGLEIITPRIVVDRIEANEIVAGKIRANQIEGLEILANEIVSNKITDAMGRLNIQPVVSDQSLVVSQENASGSAVLADTTSVNFDKPVVASLDLSVLGKLFANNGLTVSGTAEFMGDTIFNSGVTFAVTPTFNKDTAGFAVINRGEQEIEIEFENEYAGTPVVTANAIWDVDQATLDVMKQLGTYVLPKQEFIVARTTTKGFMIILETPAVTDLKFSWTAIAVKDAKTTVGLNLISPTPFLTLTPAPLLEEIIPTDSLVSPSPVLLPTGMPGTTP